MPSILPSGETYPLLQVSNLSVTYAGNENPILVLHELNLDIAAGKIIGVLGESGCGKSTLAMSLLRLLPPRTYVVGEILFYGQNIFRLNDAALRCIRGAKISLIHQDPGLALSPVMRIGEQISEVIRAHSTFDHTARRQEVEQILSEVQLLEVDRIYNAYPHQLSGGELHRVAIAQALACRPDLVIADESTRSLDLGTQAEILSLLSNINRKLGTAILFITHNPALLAGFAHRVVVIYAGHIVEEGSTADVFRHPLHPYTNGLLQSVPRSLRESTSQKLVPVIPGGPPELKLTAQNCVFEPRCAQRMTVCRSERPQEILPEKDHRVSCFIYEH